MTSCNDDVRLGKALEMLALGMHHCPVPHATVFQDDISSISMNEAINSTSSHRPISSQAHKIHLLLNGWTGHDTKRYVCCLNVTNGLLHNS